MPAELLPPGQKNESLEHGARMLKDGADPEKSELTKSAGCVMMFAAIKQNVVRSHPVRLFARQVFICVYPFFIRVIL